MCAVLIACTIITIRILTEIDLSTRECLISRSETTKTYEGRFALQLAQRHEIVELLLVPALVGRRGDLREFRLEIDHVLHLPARGVLLAT